MDTAQRTIYYLFILSLVLIVVAYYTGANQLLSTFFSGVTSVGNTYTGRNAQGVFAGYPAGATTGIKA